MQPDNRRVERDAVSVLASIASTTGHHTDTVEIITAAIRTVIDDLLADDHIVITGDLFVSFGDSPTRRAVIDALKSNVPIPDAVLRLDPQAVADWLGLDLDTYVRRPLASKSLVGAEVFELLGDVAPERPVVWDILEAWDATFAGGRIYKVGTVGRELAVENWLVDNLDRLRHHGLPVALVHRQLVLPNRKIPDLICRFSEDTNSAVAGDWLIIELKATRFYPAAADQIDGYLDQVSEHLAAAGEQVLGLLITDGADYDEIIGLNRRGLDHLTLSALGYRIMLAQDVAPPTAELLVQAPARPGTEHVSLDAPLLFESSPVTDGDAGPDWDGPETYWVRLFFDTSTGDPAREATERAAAQRLWSKREHRRVRYEQVWGPRDQWPARHPTTVIDVGGPSTFSAAVCINCDWLARATDLAGVVVDLQSEAKAHALEHTHDPVLEDGQNPPKQPRVPGLDGVLAEARANGPRRAARRVARRE